MPSASPSAPASATGMLQSCSSGAHARCSRAGARPQRPSQCRRSAVRRRRRTVRSRARSEAAGGRIRRLPDGADSGQHTASPALRRRHDGVSVCRCAQRRFSASCGVDAGHARPLRHAARRRRRAISMRSPRCATAGHGATRGARSLPRLVSASPPHEDERIAAALQDLREHPGQTARAGSGRAQGEPFAVPLPASVQGRDRRAVSPLPDVDAHGRSRPQHGRGPVADRSRARRGLCQLVALQRGIPRDVRPVALAARGGAAAPFRTARPERQPVSESAASPLQLRLCFLSAAGDEPMAAADAPSSEPRSRTALCRGLALRRSRGDRGLLPRRFHAALFRPESRSPAITSASRLRWRRWQNSRHAPTAG